MSRLNQILVGLLVVQLIVGALVLLPRTAATTGEVSALFPGLDAEHVVGLTISSADGRSIRLEKEDGGWVVAGTDGYPVLEEQVPEFLGKIVALSDARLVTETPGSHKRLKVDDAEYERLVEVELDDGSQDSFYIGSSPSYGAVHVRVEGEDEVYLISDLGAQDAGVEATDWVDRTYVSIPSEDVTALTLENASGTYRFLKVGDAWTMEGLTGDEVLNATTVQTLLSRATSITLAEPLGKEEKAEYGLGAPAAVVDLTLGDRNVKLSVGARDAESGNYVVASSESPYFVRVQEFSVRDFVEKVRTDFLQQPTPIPEATPGG